jgi:dienelactone hydrolase
MVRRKWFWILAITFALFFSTGGWIYYLVMPGAVFASRAADSSLESQTAGDPFEEWEEVAISGGRKIPIRVYQPTEGHTRTVMLVPGLHWAGYNEERLVPFARKVAGMGVMVVTPDIDDLKSYDITEQAVDDLEQAILWSLGNARIATEDGKIGIMGICFAGGLGLSVATRPSLEDRIAYVFTFGAHADIDRTMEYLVTGTLPDGTKLQAHPYGQIILFRQFCAQIVPKEEVTLMRECLLDLLYGGAKVSPEKVKRLSKTSLSYYKMATDWHTDELGKVLAPVLKGYRSPPALSPIRQPAPSFPVYALHGSVDNVVPPSESQRIAEWAPDSTLLISDLVVHVELEESKEQNWGDMWDLALFWSKIFRE